MISDEDFARLERKIDLIYEMLSSVLVEANYITKIRGLNKNTITQNDKLEKYNQIGKRKLLLTLESVQVIRNRKKRK